MTCPFCGTRVDEHEAGRCLDAWVADAVFKMQVDNDTLRRSLSQRVVVPHYSTTWEGLGLVVDKIECIEAFLVRASEEKGGDWHSCIATDEWKGGASKATTAPLAVCRAALKAVGEAEGGDAP